MRTLATFGVYDYRYHYEGPTQFLILFAFISVLLIEKLAYINQERVCCHKTETRWLT